VQSEHPAAEGNDDDDEMMDADEGCDVQIPVANFRSNHIAQKQVNLDQNGNFIENPWSKNFQQN
jgi:hypothetical protein